jgi:DNA-directed RNA polymerase specialized sigma subunit
MGRKEQELRLFELYRDGDQEAKKELLSSLKPLIRSQAQRFAGSGLPQVAVELEGVRLASEAIDTYNPKQFNTQLNTHVVNRLKKLSRFVTNYQNIGHIPEPRALMIGKYHNIFENLEADKGREPTQAELSDALHVSIAEIERLQSELRKDLSMTVEDDSDAGGFYFYSDTTTADPKLLQALEFVYFDADNIDKKILEYTFGMGNTPKLLSGQIISKLRISGNELRTRKAALGKEIKQLIK